MGTVRPDAFYRDDAFVRKCKVQGIQNGGTGNELPLFTQKYTFGAYGHLLLLCLLSPLAYLYSGFSLLQTGIYLLVPYLLTVVLGLYVTRKVPGRESLAACACITAAVSGLCAFLKFSFSMLWSPAFRDEWFTALLLLLFLSALEVRKTVRQLEGNKWNFS